MPVSFKKKGNLASKSFRKRDERDGPDAVASEELRPNVEHQEETVEEENLSAPKRQKTQHMGGLVASAASAKEKESSVYKPYESSKSAEQSFRGDAQTGGYRDDQTDKERDSRGIKERVMKENAER